MLLDDGGLPKMLKQTKFQCNPSTETLDIINNNKSLNNSISMLHGEGTLHEARHFEHLRVHCAFSVFATK